MFPGHFNIPGHSGTDVKHKRAFNRVRTLLKNRQHSYLNQGRKVSRESADRNTWGLPGWLRKGTVILLLLLMTAVGAGIGWIVWDIADTYVASSPKVRSEAPDWDAYRVLTISGDGLVCTYVDKAERRIYDRSFLNAARTEYELALRAVPGDYWAEHQLTVIEDLELRDWRE